MTYLSSTYRPLDSIKLLTADEVVQAVTRLVVKHVGTRQGVHLFLFGSRAAQKHSNRSDFDFGIELVDQETGRQEKLSATARFRIEGELESLPILQKIDLVDFSRVSDSFRKLATKYVVTLYKN